MDTFVACEAAHWFIVIRAMRHLTASVSSQPLQCKGTIKAYIVSQACKAICFWDSDVLWCLTLLMLLIAIQSGMRKA